MNSPTPSPARSWATPRLLNAATVVAVVALGILLLARPLRRLAESRRARIGSHAVTSGDSATDLHGMAHPLIAHDSLTLLLFLDTTCTACVARATSLVALAHWAGLQRIAVRALTPASAATSRFARAGGTETPFMTTNRALYARLGIVNIPSALYVDSTGVRGRFIGGIPIELQVLRVLDALER